MPAEIISADIIISPQRDSTRRRCAARKNASEAIASPARKIAGDCSLARLRFSLERPAFQSEVRASRDGSRPVSINAVVFDTYGTLYDVQSVADVTEEAFPGYGELITQVWRIKQLEYSWLRSLMRRYEDFSVITRDSLSYTLRILGLQYDDGVFARLMDK